MFCTLVPNSFCELESEPIPVQESACCDWALQQLTASYELYPGVPWLHLLILSNVALRLVLQHVLIVAPEVTEPVTQPKPIPFRCKLTYLMSASNLRPHG